MSDIPLQIYTVFSFTSHTSAVSRADPHLPILLLMQEGTVFHRFKIDADPKSFFVSFCLLCSFVQGPVDNALDIYPASELRVHAHVLLDCLWPASKGNQGGESR